MGDNFTDTSKPSPGRIYDYFLGGNHNFEIDRQLGDQVIALLPFITKFSLLQRWALYDVAAELTVKRGFNVIIDFASGLPTPGHIHTNVPEGTIVIYSDVDPVTVEYAKTILKDVPNVYYFQNDANQPDELLNQPEVLKILGKRRKVAIGYWGFSLLQTESEIKKSISCIYDWVAPGSCLAYNANSVPDPQDPAMLKSQEIYEKLGSPIYERSLEKHIELLQPWKLEPEGFISLLDWHGLNQARLSREDMLNLAPCGGGFGAFLYK